MTTPTPATAQPSSDPAQAGPVFRLIPEPTFNFVVRLPVPGQPGMSAELPLLGRVLGRRALTDWLKQPADAVAQGQPAPGDAPWLAQVIAGWSVVDELGRPVPFGVAALETLLDAYLTNGRPILEAYLEALKGERAKNS